MTRKTKVAVGLSGGVDSSAAAALLLEQGYEVVGVTMTIWDGSIDLKGAGDACFGPGEEKDVELAAKLCDRLGIEFREIDLKKEYKQIVLSYFREEYLKGRTPNPCVVCNRNLKFGFLLSRAEESGVEFDLFATGHYARIDEIYGRYRLRKGLDESKEQSYFLHAIKRERLAKTIFPLGSLTKAAAREIARRYGMEAADKLESQDFISGGSYEVLFEKDDSRPGDIVTLDGKRVGGHRGIVNYTVGQRKGLGLSCARPMYVVAIDAKKNQVVVAEEEALSSNSLVASCINWLSIDAPAEPMRVKARIRQKHREADALLEPLADGSVKVVFDEPQRAVTPGQSVVFYDGDVVLGGGVIDKAERVSS